VAEIPLGLEGHLPFRSPLDSLVSFGFISSRLPVVNFKFLEEMSPAW